MVDDIEGNGKGAASPLVAGCNASASSVTKTFPVSDERDGPEGQKSALAITSTTEREIAAQQATCIVLTSSVIAMTQSLLMKQRCCFWSC